MKRLLAFCVAASIGATPCFAQQNGPRTPVNTLRDLGSALWSCWSPPPDAQDFQVTVILSLKANGEVLGKPRITYSRFNGDVDDQKQIMQAILGSLDDCTPVSVTPALGHAIAGRIFTMTFRPRSYKS